MTLADQLENIKALRYQLKFFEAFNLLDEIALTLEHCSKTEKILYLLEKGWCFRHIFQYEEALTCAQEALRFAEQSPIDNLGQIDAIDLLGGLYHRLGEINRAETYYQRSLDLSRQHGFLDRFTRSLNNIGAIFFTRGKLDVAETYLKDSLSQLDKISTPSIENTSIALLLLGHINLERGDLEKAEDYYQKFHNLRKTITPVSEALPGLSKIYFLRGELLKAEQYIREHLEEYENVSHEYQIPWYISEARYLLIEILLASNQIESALSEINLLKSLYQETQHPWVVINHLLAQTNLKIVQHEYFSALQHASQAKNKAIEATVFSYQIEAMKLQLQIYLQLFLITRSGEYQKYVADLIQELLELSEHEKLHKTYIEILLVRGIFTQHFNLSEAIQILEKAEKLAINGGYRQLIKKTRDSLIQIRKQINIWKTLQENNPDIYERLKNQEMIGYLEEAKDIIKGRI